MIVVADTSPLNYLIQLQLDELLKRLYGEILIPIEVAEGTPCQWSTESSTKLGSAASFVG